MAHLHIHTLPDGVETSIAVIDPENDQLHWHTVDDGRTSTDPFGDGHTHTFEGATTSGPIDRQSNKGQPVNIEHATLSFKMVPNSFSAGGWVAVFVSGYRFFNIWSLL